MRTRVEARTDKGLVRKNNEDSFLLDPAARLLVVCDGMGGHAGGEVASAMAVETMKQLLTTPGDALESAMPPAELELPVVAAELVAAVRLTHTRIYATAVARPELKDMGTTLAAIRFAPDGAVAVVNVGDSRVYRFRGGHFSQLTRDHTYLSDLMEDNEITPEEARNFRGKNVLSRSLGTAPSVKVDLRVDNALAGDVYLACSDGLSGPLDDHVIARLVSDLRNDLPALARALVDEANRRGGPDNVTVVLAAVDTSPQSEPAVPLKLEVADDETEFWNREKVLRKLFDLPVQRETKIPWLLVGGGASLLAALVLIFLFAGHKRRAPTRYVDLLIEVTPQGAAKTAEVWFDGNKLERPWRVDSVRCDTGYVLRVESDGYLPVSKTISVDTPGVFRQNMEGGAELQLAYSGEVPRVHFQAINEHETLLDREVDVPFPSAGFLRIRAGTYTFKVWRNGAEDFTCTGVALKPGARLGIVPDGSVKLIPSEMR